MIIFPVLSFIYFTPLFVIEPPAPQIGERGARHFSELLVNYLGKEIFAVGSRIVVS
jgi:hypothetical protein